MSVTKDKRLRAIKRSRTVLNGRNQLADRLTRSRSLHKHCRLATPSECAQTKLPTSACAGFRFAQLIGRFRAPSHRGTLHVPTKFRTRLLSSLPLSLSPSLPHSLTPSPSLPHPLSPSPSSPCGPPFPPWFPLSLPTKLALDQREYPPHSRYQRTTESTHPGCRWPRALPAARRGATW